MLVYAGLFAFGCAPSIGDRCGNSTDCSATGDRICDTAQPRGYCTIEGCDPDSCPGSSVCVEWRFEPSRTAATYCMKTCGSCRRGYTCVGQDDPLLVSEDGEQLSRIIDTANRDARICIAEPVAATSSSVSEASEASEAEADAGP